MSDIAGWQVVVLLGGAFRSIIGELHAELAEAGHPQARPLHGFALQAVGPDGSTIGQLGQRLGVTKQAAAKTARALEDAGYVVREASPTDRRAVRLVRSARGEEMLRLSAEFFEQRMQRWRREVGDLHVDVAVGALQALGGDTWLGDLPGWLG